MILNFLSRSPLQKPIWLIGLYLLLSILAISCGSPKHVNHLPSNVDMVVTINTKRMLYKAIDLETLFALIDDENAIDTGKINQDVINESVAESGVNLTETIYVYATTDPADNQEALHAIIGLENAAKFKKFISSFDSAASFYDKDGYTFYAKQHIIIAFNDEVAFASAKQNAERPQLEYYIKTAIEQTEETALITTNKAFKEQQDKTFEIACWLNTSFFSKKNKMVGIAAGEYLENNYLTSEVTFGEGKISISTKLNINNPELQRFERFMDAPLPEALYSMGPVARPLAFGGIKIDMKVLSTFLNENNLLKTPDSWLRLVGSNSQEFLDAINGEIMIALSRIYDKNLLPELFIAFNVSDTTKASALISKLDNQGLLEQRGNYHESGFFDSDYSLMLDKGCLLLFSTPMLRQEYQAGKYAPIEPAMYSNLRGGAFTIHLQPKELVQQATGYVSADFYTFCTKFEGFDLTFAQKDTDAWESECTITLANQKENSLQEFVKYIRALGMKEKHPIDDIDTARIKALIDKTTTIQMLQ